MIEQILPPGVCAVEAFTDLLDAVRYDSEEAAISRAVEARRREFRTTRACARAALARLGYPPGPIPSGPRGEPQWPDGVVGSMTHCQGYRAAAVANRRDFVTIGIDAEVHAPLPDGILDAIALPAEREQLRRLAAGTARVCWDRLLFSAKESVYKAWFPLARRMLDFHEAEVTIEPAGAFTARLLVPGPVVDGVAIGAFAGRWLARDGIVLTAITH